jgi:hypothetical protein
MHWIPFISLLVVIVLLFVAALRDLSIPRHAAPMLGLGSFLLCGALTLSLFVPFVSDHPQALLGILAGLLTGLGLLFLVVAFMRLAQPPIPQRSEAFEAEDESETG